MQLTVRSRKPLFVLRNLDALARAQLGLPGRAQAFGAVLSGKRRTLQDTRGDLGCVRGDLPGAFDERHHA